MYFHDSTIPLIGTKPHPFQLKEEVEDVVVSNLCGEQGKDCGNQKRGKPAYLELCVQMAGGNAATVLFLLMSSIFQQFLWVRMRLCSSRSMVTCRTPQLAFLGSRRGNSLTCVCPQTVLFLKLFDCHAFAREISFNSLMHFLLSLTNHRTLVFRLKAKTVTRPNCFRFALFTY